ncbi:hypothetical protein [Nocardioides aequoreus]|uniref:hypothetical protein n=1 Tax=Nocardioides aequoreus TaxID=397278 RepID=UPI0004C45B05|nr:hypothetical protein [Nocardioides aequoreus]
MLLLLSLPIVAAVAAGHRYLQIYAPTNVFVRRLSAKERWRTAAVLGVVGSTLLMAMHAAASAVANGAPGWLNLLVLLLAWDAIKLELAALGSAARCLWSGRRGLRSATLGS